MVKNTHGGSGHKKFGRKHVVGAKNSNKLRLSEDEGEIYAIVTKMLGNGMFHCYCMDGVTRLGHIRGKFSGRGKRDNMVEVGKWLLIGLREWDIPNSSGSSAKAATIKMQQCDLLEVYNDSDKLRLRDTVDENWYSFDSNDSSKTKEMIDINSDVAFLSEKDVERERLVEEMKSETMEKITLKTTEIADQADEEEEINFEDI